MGWKQGYWPSQVTRDENEGILAYQRTKQLFKEGRQHVVLVKKSMYTSCHCFNMYGHMPLSFS